VQATILSGFEGNNTNKIRVVSGNGLFTCDNIWDESPEFYFFSKGIEETVPYDIIIHTRW